LFGKTPLKAQNDYILFGKTPLKAQNDYIFETFRWAVAEY